MLLYIALLKSLLHYRNYEKYYNSLNLDFIQKNYPDLFKLFSVLPTLHASKQDKEYTPLDLEFCLLKEYPKADELFYKAILDDLAQQQADPALVEGYLQQLAERNQALETAKLALKASEGFATLAEVKQFVEKVPVAAPAHDWRSKFCDLTLRELAQQHFKEVGFRWRLKSLNKALGSLRKGDFGFVFARPETGKTTFLASEMSFMASQLKEEDGPIIWFNNEEQGGKVRIRCYQAVCGRTAEEVLADPDAYEQEFIEKTGGRLRIFDEKLLTKAEVEMVCEEMQPSIIIFDQIDKIVGFDGDRHDLEMKVLYAWARSLADKYGPVIAVCQAGGSGDNKKWLTMNDVDSSKTSKQGEADWILGIGYTFDAGMEQVRHLHLSKNKLLGDPDTDPNERHGKWSVLIKPDIAQYRDFNHDGA